MEEYIQRMEQKRLELMEAGVRMVDPSSVYVAEGVIIGAGTLLLPGVILRGETEIGSDCTIGPFTMITDCKIGDGVTINQSQCNQSTLRDGAQVGPFAYIRPNCTVGERVRVGDFVELKNSNLGAGTKVPHLSYVGDSDVGERVNIGCGTVTVNYDGNTKHRTTIGDDCFVGCNTNLVAPVTMGAGSYSAAGSTITDDVAPDALAVARARQVERAGWAARHREKKD